jgi:hypothetical protein
VTVAPPVMFCMNIRSLFILNVCHGRSFPLISWLMPQIPTHGSRDDFDWRLCLYFGNATLSE